MAAAPGGRRERGQVRFDFSSVVPADHKMMRLINRANVLNIVRERAPISRVEIAKLTGLKKSTISSIVGELIGEGLVYEDSLGESAIGRKPIILRVNEQSRAIGVIDVRHVETVVAVCDLGGKVLEQRVLPTVDGDGEGFFSGCGRVVGEMAARIGIRLEGVGVSAPSVANHIEGIIYRDPTHHWENLKVSELVSRYAGCRVFTENDGKAGALAQLWFAPETKDLTNFVFIMVCEGIGAGMVINKTLYHGAYSLDSQFGQQLIRIDDKWTEINPNNTWEDNASDLGAVRRYLEYGGGDFSTEVRQIEAVMRQVVDRALEGERNALRALRETARYLGVGLANINNGLGPERIVIAGRMTRAWEIIFPELCDQMRRLTAHPLLPVEELVVPSSLERPTFLGTQAMVLNHVFKSYKILS